ncbi:MAG: ribose-5-phosphate isomerase RpiA [Alphaproteobacteria bacterium]
MTGSDSATLKRAAAMRALDLVHEGMKLGLGTGSTAEVFLELLAGRIRGGLKIIGTPTSKRTEDKARALGIPLDDLDRLAPLDLTVDGADEADSELNLIKGGGGALLREKIVAASSKRMAVIADESKLVSRLGKFPLPVEVIAFGHATTAHRITAAAAKLGYKTAPNLRVKDGAPYRTDNGNCIYDCPFGAITDVPKLATAISQVTGVVEQGLFVGLATELVLAGPRGVRLIQRHG